MAKTAPMLLGAVQAQNSDQGQDVALLLSSDQLIELPVILHMPLTSSTGTGQVSNGSRSPPSFTANAMQVFKVGCLKFA